MGRRVDVLSEFTAALQNGAYYKTLPPRGVARGFKWIDTINDFPYITYNVQESTLTHIGDNNRYYAMEIALRAYVRSEDPQGDLDQLMLDIEQIVISFGKSSTPSLEVVDARVDSINSDEGLMAPFGVTDMRLTISYRQSSSV